MSDEASPIRSTGFQPEGRSGILLGQGGEETGKMPVGPTAKMAVLQGRARRSNTPRGVLRVTNSLERRRHD
jgi:hypothetical protein